MKRAAPAPAAFEEVLQPFDPPFVSPFVIPLLAALALFVTTCKKPRDVAAPSESGAPSRAMTVVVAARSPSPRASDVEDWYAVLASARSAREAFVGKEAREDAAEAVAEVRLGDVVGREHEARVGSARDDDDGDPREARVRAQGRDERSAIHPGQLQVDEREVGGGQLAGRIERALTVAREHGLASRLAYDAREEVGHLRLVLDDEHHGFADRIERRHDDQAADRMPRLPRVDRVP